MMEVDVEAVATVAAAAAVVVAASRSCTMPLIATGHPATRGSRRHPRPCDQPPHRHEEAGTLVVDGLLRLGQPVVSTPPHLAPLITLPYFVLLLAFRKRYATESNPGRVRP